MLSEEQFEMEVDLLMHPRVKECLRYCKLIGPNNDEALLKRYANELTCQYIKEQVQYFPNTQRVIDFWIITAHELFYRIIVEDDLPTNEMPPIQLTLLIAKQEDDMIKIAKDLKSSLNDAAL